MNVSMNNIDEIFFEIAEKMYDFEIRYSKTPSVIILPYEIYIDGCNMSIRHFKGIPCIISPDIEEIEVK